MDYLLDRAVGRACHPAVAIDLGEGADIATIRLQNALLGVGQGARFEPNQRATTTPLVATVLDGNGAPVANQHVRIGVDILAPGSAITSANYSNNTGSTSMSGTSMATPHVAGAAARYLQGNRSATPAQVASYLVGQSTPSKVTSPGTGSPNRLLYLAPSA